MADSCNEKFDAAQKSMTIFINYHTLYCTVGENLTHSNKMQTFTLRLNTSQ